MPIEVLYFAELKDITGINRETFNSEIKNISELVELLIVKYHPLKELLRDELTQNLRKKISIALNENIIQVKDKLSIKLSNGDRIAFLLSASGG